MKYVVSLMLGIVAGAGVAIGAIYFNPLTLSQSEPANAPNWVLSYALSDSETWLSTHDDRLGIPVVPGDAPLLFENGIKGSMLAAMPLRDEAGNLTAAATRISVPSSQTEFLRAGLLVEDYWLISMPGEGSVFVHAVNNQWPLLRDTLVRVDWLQRDWRGPSDYGPTKGPGTSGAEVIGLTGQYAGARGRGSERLSLDAYEGSLVQLTGQLMLEVSDAQL